MAWLLPSLRPPAPVLRSPREGSVSGALWATSREGPDTDEVIISPTLAASPPALAPGEPRCLAPLAQEQLQQWSSNLGISHRSLTGFPRRRRRTGRRDHGQVHLQGAGPAQESVRPSGSEPDGQPTAQPRAEAPARTPSPPACGTPARCCQRPGCVDAPGAAEPAHRAPARPSAHTLKGRPVRSQSFPDPVRLQDAEPTRRPRTSYWGPPGGGDQRPGPPRVRRVAPIPGLGSGSVPQTPMKAVSLRERG